MNDATSGDRILAMVLRLFDGLHRSGVNSSLAEVLDAVATLRHIDLFDRNMVRVALKSALVKRPEDSATFELLFEQCFVLTGDGLALNDDREAGMHASNGAHLAADGESDQSTDHNTDRGARGTPGKVAADSFDDELRSAITTGSHPDLRQLARAAVQRYAAIAVSKGSEKYYLQRVLRALDLSQLLVDAMRESRLADPGADELALRHRRDDLHERLDAFKQLLAEEIRRDLFADVTRTGVGLIAPRRIEDTDVLGADAAQLRAMREAIGPLARKLARKLSSQRRRNHHGRLDVRRTVRRSLSTGGVPLDPLLRRRSPSKPDVLVLSDISGSVAEFAHFTLMLLQALQSELRALRTFVFVDGVAEITDVLSRAGVDLDPRLLVTLPGVVVDDGHSDYEAAIRRFLDHHGTAVGPSTTVIVTGDGRTNYRSPGTEGFRLLCSRARAVYWFDPEPRESWHSHDSAMSVYEQHCDGVFEVRTLRQLSDAIAAIL
jgi:uncharacterized protein